MGYFYTKTSSSRVCPFQKPFNILNILTSEFLKQLTCWMWDLYTLNFLMWLVLLMSLLPVWSDRQKLTTNLCCSLTALLETDISAFFKAYKSLLLAKLFFFLNGQGRFQLSVLPHCNIRVFLVGHKHCFYINCQFVVFKNSCPIVSF